MNQLKQQDDVRLHRKGRFRGRETRKCGLEINFILKEKQKIYTHKYSDIRKHRRKRVISEETQLLRKY